MASTRETDKWKEKARSSAEALVEVKIALSYPADIVQRARLYTKSLKGLDGKNLSKII